MDCYYKEILSDNDILKALKLGIYTVDLELGLIKGHKGNYLTPYVGNKEGHLFVRLYVFAKRKAIAVSRLVWLAGSGRSIPKGFEIHHRDLNTQNNRWTNLFCLFKLDHNKLHNGSNGVLVEDKILI